MSFSLSASPQPISPSPRKQRAVLLMASALVHIAVLVPVALNTVFLPPLDIEDDSFEVWINLREDFPRPVDLPKLLPKILQPTKPVPLKEEERQPEETLTERTREEPVPQPVPPQPQSQQLEQATATPNRPVDATLPRLVEQQAIQLTPMTRLDNLQSTMPDLESPPDPVVTETLQGPRSPAAVSDLAPSPNIALAPRPHIEAIDGPAPGRSLSPLDNNRSLPSVQPSPTTATNTTANDNGSAVDALPDAPVPRRARLSEEEEAALALARAAAGATAGGSAGGAASAIQDAWVYTPEAGGGGGAGGGATGQSGRGIAGNTANQGTVSFRGTPVDCSMPHRLSDIQRLSCDSAEQRRIQSAIDRGVRVMGTSNAERDAGLAAQGQARIRAYEDARTNSGGVGVSQDDLANTRAREDAIDNMSGTHREIQKSQDAMRRSPTPQ